MSMLKAANFNCLCVYLIYKFEREPISLELHQTFLWYLAWPIS